MDKKTLAMLTIGLLLGGGAIGAYQVMAQNSNVMAQTSNTVSTAPPANQQEVQNPSYQGSITVDEATTEGQSEQAESQALAGLATITADQAKQAAETQVGGTASSVKLGDENGSLVYEVTIGNQEVKVDAGNGQILQVEQSDSGPDQAEQGEVDNANEVEDAN